MSMVTYRKNRDLIFFDDASHTRVARDILDYVLRDMTGLHGGFYSAEDADGPLPENPEIHVASVFYLSTKKEIVKILGPKIAKLFICCYGVNERKLPLLIETRLQSFGSQRRKRLCI